MLTGLALFKKARDRNLWAWFQWLYYWLWTEIYSLDLHLKVCSKHQRQIEFYLHHNLLLFFNFMATSSHVTSYHWLNNIKLKKEHGSSLFNIHKSDIFKNEFRGENGTANIIFKQTKCICNKSTPRILTLNITDTLNFNDTKFCVAMVYYTFRKN